jgi:O-antigen ligase
VRLGPGYAVLERLSPLTVVFNVVTAAAVFAFALGAGTAALAATFDDAAPYVLLGVALAPLVALGVLAAPIVGPLAVFATLPVGSIGASLRVVSVQAAEASVLAVGLLIVLRRLGAGRTPLAWSGHLSWAVALLGWTLVALYDAIDTALALKQVVALAGGIVFASVVLSACRDLVDLRRLMAGFVAAVTIIAATALASGGSYQTTYGGATVVSGRLQGAFDHPNQLGSVCAMAAPIAAALVLGGRRTRTRLVAAVAMTAIVGALLLSLSRGAWVGAGLGFLLIFVRLREARRLVLVLSVPAVIAGFFFSSLAATPTELEVVEERARALTELSPYDDRDAIYAEAQREIRAEPLTGFGPGGFPIASARAGSETSTVAPKHAHNLGLTWAAEAGIPALILILAFAAALAFAVRDAGRAALARGDRSTRILAVGLGASLLSVVGQGFFDYTLRNAVVHIALWGVIGALLVCAREAGRYPVSSTRSAL